jgi:ABC-type transport system involved in multi-copper enzyme maturation permease subunit
MNALIRKEVRSILPVWSLAMVLAVVPVWILWPGPQGAMPDSVGILVFAPFVFGVLLLSLTPFGQELNWGTLSVLLAQPVPRRTVWLVKTVVLAVALTAALVGLVVSSHLRVDSILETMKHTVWRNAFDQPSERSNYFINLVAGIRHAALRDTLMVGILAVVTGLAGGLWTTLLLRQVTAAFWLTFLVPVGLLLLAGKVLGNFPEPVAQAGLIVVLAGYSAAGFTWAKRLFLQAQDIQWTGGVVSLTSRSPRAAGEARLGARRPKPLRALWSKEFEIQFINLLLAAGILLLHLLVVAIRKWSAGYLVVHRSVAMSLEAFPVIWLAVPLLIGSTAFAEERKNGTLAGALCLPASRRLQFVIRLAVAMTLGTVCGGVVPLLVEHLAGRIGLGQNPTWEVFFLGANRSAFVFQVFAATGIAGLAFYGSTLARNSLQAIGIGLVVCLGGCLLVFAAEITGMASEFILWRGGLIFFIGVPVLMLAWLTLTYRNSQQLHLDLKVLRRNLLTWLFAILGVAGVTTTIYHRVWEAWLPEEPPHRAFFGAFAGNNRWVQTVPLELPAAKIRTSGLCTSVILPDGRLWLRQSSYGLSQTIAPLRMIASFIGRRSHAGFVEGSGWKDVAVTWNQTFAIKKDGTLWDLSSMNGGEFRPERVGQDRDWVSLCAGAFHFCALKSDGTLWQWGRWNKWLGTSRPPGRPSLPSQVGTDSDWLAIGSSWDFSAAFKSDGSIWRWSWASPKHPVPEPWLNGPCSLPASITMTDHAIACVCRDGTLWLGCDFANSGYSRLVDSQFDKLPSQDLLRWGTDSDWKEIHWVGWGNQAVGIKRDGSMWEWDINVANGMRTGWIISPTQPSRYMDWACAGADNNNAFLALARDGSLCLWGDLNHDRPDPYAWLMPSRIKARRMADFSRQR